MKERYLFAGITFIPTLFFNVIHAQSVVLNNKNDSLLQPNVIFILTDDQGYGDLGCHGNQWIKTPNLDQFYKQCIRFTNYHVGTTSAPTRAGLMTGKYCNSVGVWHTVNGRSLLSLEENTIADILKDAGYNTGIFGKWHLGDNYPYRPQDRGFSEVLIHKGGGVGQQPDYWNNDYFNDTYFRNGIAELFNGYCTDIWFSEAMNFIEENKNIPFFCYIATNAPHGPYHVEEKYIDMYANNPHIVNPNFYGMITNIDDNFGRLMRKLELLNILDNTIIVYMSDNGTAAGVKVDENENVVYGFNANMRGIKSSVYDGGHRVPFFLYLPFKQVLAGRDISHITSYVDFVPTVLDLCNIATVKSEYDGISLKPFIYKEKATYPKRIVFTDTQREENLVKWKNFAVMTDRWRLIGQSELYDINADSAQQINLAKKYPDIVSKLLLSYESWWEKMKNRGDRYSYIQIGGLENPTRLNSHDCHSSSGLPVWSQSGVRLANGNNGFWTIEAVVSGKYEFSLYRWPKESLLALGEHAFRGTVVQGGAPYPPGKAIDIKKAYIKLDDHLISKVADKEKHSIKFTLNISKGKYNLECRFIDLNDTEIDAYYVYVNSIDTLQAR